MIDRKLVFLTTALALIACEGTPAETDAGTDGGPSGRDSGPGYDAGSYTRIAETEASAGRSSCAFGRGAMPWETVWRSWAWSSVSSA